MNKLTHPIDPEELMAYLDGELPAARAAATAAHLGECEECQAAVDGFRNVSQTLKAWNVGAVKTEIPQGVVNALEERREVKRDDGKSGWRRIWRRQPLLAYAGLMATVVIALIGTTRFIGGNSNNVFSQVASQVTDEPPFAAVPSREFSRLEQFAKVQKAPSATTQSYGYGLTADTASTHSAGISPRREQPSSEDKALTQNAPMIIRTAELQLITKEFDKTRTAMEAILKKHHGYIADLKVEGATGSGRTLTSTLRVPADQLDSTLTELKTLGRVSSESQGGQDVTSQYVDLQARLANSRNTEKRLTDILNNRTGKLKDVLDVEEELDRVRGEIEEMEAESKQMTKQVSFATVNVSITEDYKAQIEIVPPSTATRLGSAAVDGYRSMVDGVIGVALFALSNDALLACSSSCFVPPLLCDTFARAKQRRARPLHVCLDRRLRGKRK